MNASEHKASKGSVGIESFQGRLRLRLPRQIYKGKQKYLTLGLADTPENRKAAESKAHQIDLDISAGYFDPTLAKYKPQTHLTLVQPIKEPETTLTLSELWNLYAESRRNLVSPSTWKSGYMVTQAHIQACPYKTIDEAVKVRDWFIANRTPDAAKRVITQLSACSKWAVKLKLISENLFAGMAAEIEVSKLSPDDIDPFAPAERDAIIAAFETEPRFHRYASLVKFLFMTGCRTSEAIGLQWQHITNDCRAITFCEAVVSCEGGRTRKESTKTKKSRKFPCNASLQSFLLSIRPDNPNPKSPVFPDANGEVNARSFHYAWHGKHENGVVTRLVKEGKVERYRPQYNTRHTFITQCLEAGVSPIQVGKWVGNSPEIIMKHYAGIIRRVQVPEF